VSDCGNKFLGDGQRHFWPLMNSMATSDRSRGKHKHKAQDLQEVLAYKMCFQRLLIRPPQAPLNEVSQEHLNYLASMSC